MTNKLESRLGADWLPRRGGFVLVGVPLPCPYLWISLCLQPSRITLTHLAC